MKSERWTQAMREEMNALKRNLTWEIVDKTKDNKVHRVQMDIYNET